MSDDPTPQVLESETIWTVQGKQYKCLHCPTCKVTNPNKCTFSKLLKLFIAIYLQNIVAKI